MPLTIDVTKCNNYESLSVGDRQDMALNAVVVGMPELTTKNYLEFAARLRFVEDMESLSKHEVRRTSLRKIKDFIGMRVNVKPGLRSRLVYSLAKARMEEIRRNVEREDEMTLVGPR